jgi:hypothetical protein
MLICGHSGNQALRLNNHPAVTVQAGTPMTVTGNGTSLRVPGRGVLIFCPQVSSEVCRWIRHRFEKPMAWGGEAHPGLNAGRRP